MSSDVTDNIGCLVAWSSSPSRSLLLLLILTGPAQTSEHPSRRICEREHPWECTPMRSDGRCIWHDNAGPMQKMESAKAPRISFKIGVLAHGRRRCRHVAQRRVAEGDDPGSTHGRLKYAELCDLHIAYEGVCRDPMIVKCMIVSCFEVYELDKHNRCADVIIAILSYSVGRFFPNYGTLISFEIITRSFEGATHPALHPTSVHSPAFGEKGMSGLCEYLRYFAKLNSAVRRKLLRHLPASGGERGPMNLDGCH
ncbi:hypothetical protein EVAR_45340_1 [Eumeta japonica]|uniref:Uncharacterized protein n=1 Tax=Eumeta variegata TaxID=151549 RepID=A0A4C1XMS3_EUMVA|nr:hypothetical protein EVAR_45340_1 [Eumeta japonica]